MVCANFGSTSLFSLFQLKVDAVCVYVCVRACVCVHVHACMQAACVCHCGPESQTRRYFVAHQLSNDVRRYLVVPRHHIYRNQSF